MKQKEKTERTREKILEAAMREFGVNGYSGASLNAVCDSGISKGLLYHNFQNKDALYLACVKRGFEEMTEYLKKQPAPQGMNDYLAARLRYFGSHPVEAHLFFEAVLQPPMPLQDAIQRLKAEFDAYNQSVYLSILSTLSLRPGVTQAQALAYFSLMQTMFNGYFSSPAFQEIPLEERITEHEEGLSRFLEYLLYGIAERGQTQ